MSRKRSEDSSLELLLDTMCNTFGGVMFIAILLAVMVSIRGYESREQVPDPKERIAELKQQINSLQQELEIIMEDSRKQAETLEAMQSDPRLRLIHEIALLEQMHKEKLLLQKVALQKVNLSRSELKKAEIDSLKVVEELQKKEKELKELLEKKKEKQKIIDELNEKLGSINFKKMYFQTIVKKENMPYVIFVNGDKVWPIGPEKIQDDVIAPNPAVTYEVKSGSYICTPAEGKGISIFSGEALSAEFRQLLSSVSSDRVPDFVISKGDAASFFKLREILKQQKIFHGFVLQEADLDHFEFQILDEGKGKKSYEY